MNMTQTDLRSVRVNAGISASELAREAKVSRPTLDNAEEGKAIRAFSAARIVNALNRLTGDEYTVESLGIQTV